MQTSRAVFALGIAAALGGLSPAGAQSGWAAQSSGTSQDLNGVSFTGAAVGTVVGAGGTVLRTSDGGESWIPQASGVYDQLYDVSFATTAAGIATGGGLSVIWTADGGAHWTVAQTGYMGSFYGAHMVTDQVGFVAGVNTIFQPLVGRTIDGGLNWSYFNFYFGGSEGTLRAIHFLDEANGIAVGNIYNGDGVIVRSTTSGATWEVVLVIGDALRALDFADESHGVAVGDGGTLVWTADGGDTWSVDHAGMPVALRGVSHPAPAVIFAAGAGGTILRGEGGGPWNSQESGTYANLAGIDMVDPLAGWAVGAAGTILRTTTGGLPVTSAGEASPAADLILHGCGPNPFRQSTVLRYELRQPAAVRLEIFDSQGRRIRMLVDEPSSVGLHQAAWDGRDRHGRRVPSGVYRFRLAGTFAPDELRGTLQLLR